MSKGNLASSSKHRIFTIVLVLAIVSVLVWGASKILFNKSCAGISFAEYSNGVELLIQKFSSEAEAKKYYTAKNVGIYYLVAEDADADLRTTEVWFDSLAAPLVAENVKYAVLPWTGERSEAFWDFIDDNGLILYDKSHGAVDGTISEDDLDKTHSIYSASNYAYSWLDKSYTELERSYAYAHALRSSGLRHAINNYLLSVEASDAYSIDYWLHELNEITNEFDCGEMPTYIRENLNWIDTAQSLNDDIEGIAKGLQKLTQSGDTATLQAALLSYEGAVAGLFADMQHEADTIISEADTVVQNVDGVSIEICPTYINELGTEIGGYYSMALPASWEGKYDLECSEMPGYGYAASFYESADHQSLNGGFLFSIELYIETTDYTKQIPEYDVLGSVSVYRIGSYNVIARYPSDVQFDESRRAEYTQMTDDIPSILQSITFNNECEFSSTPIAVDSTDNQTPEEQINGNLIGEWTQLTIMGNAAPASASEWGAKFSTDGTGQFTFVYEPDDIGYIDFTYSLFDTAWGDALQGIIVEMDNAPDIKYMVKFGWSNDLQRVLMTMYDVKNSGAPNLDVYWVFYLE